MAKEKDKKREKRAKQRVSFSDELIRGSFHTSKFGDTPDQGGEDSSSESSSDSSTSSNNQKHVEEGESENADTESLVTYVLARDRERRQNVRPPSRYEDGNFVAYALNVIDDLEVQEPKS